ncbi:MAG TPA: hypothetical protein VHD90_18965 [Phototrophicaceae bacterium]|nr:hypothetical protein [Phototrophicaceae bacterium]
MAVQRKHKIRAIRPLPVEYEMTPAERRELRRRYKQSHEHPRTLDELLALPNPFNFDGIEDEQDE